MSPGLGCCKGEFSPPMRLALLTMLSLVAWIDPSPAFAQGDMSDVIERAERSVVRFDVIAGSEQWLGSGFVIEASGVVMTNHHVIAGATQAKVSFQDGRTFNVVGTKLLDAAHDIAVVKIDGYDLPVLEFAPSLPRKGETAIALGSPHGLSFTASQGIISAIRDLSSESDQKLVEGTLLQTTAPISQGNSGGPLINAAGVVVGMNTLVSTIGQNLNFAVPSTVLIAAFEKQASAPVVPLNQGASREKARSDEIRESEISDEALRRYVEDAERLFSGLKSDLTQRLKQTNERLNLYKRGKTELPPHYVNSKYDVRIITEARNREVVYFRNPIVKSKATLELSERADKLKQTLSAVVNPDRKRALYELVRQAGPPLDVRDIGDIGFFREPVVVSVFDDDDILLASLDASNRILLLLRGEPTDRLRVGDEFDSLPLYIAGVSAIEANGKELPVLVARRVPEDRLAKAIFGNERPSGLVADSPSSDSAGPSVSVAGQRDASAQGSSDDLRSLFASDPKQPRLWSDSSGKFQVKAEFVSQDDRQVILRRTDTNALLPVPKERLSSADQEFLRTVTLP